MSDDADHGGFNQAVLSAREHAHRVLKAELERVRRTGEFNEAATDELQRIVAQLWNESLSARMPMLGAAIEDQVAETIDGMRSKVSNEDPDRHQ
jgi:glutamyl-tRNA reductase